jgi:hypothetical protein
MIDAVLDLSHRMRPLERDSLRSIIGDVVQRLSPDGQWPRDPQELRHFRNALQMLSRMQQHEKMTSNGVVYCGRPDFMTDELLAALRRESREVVRPRAFAQPGHLLGVGAPLADEFARSKPLVDLVRRHAGPVEPTGVASFMFYEVEGAGVSTHVDTEVFSLNANLMLRHDYSGEPSYFYTFSTDGLTLERFVLEPGEMIISFGDSIAHGRSLLGPGEVVNNLTIGFQPDHWESHDDDTAAD